MTPEQQSPDGASGRGPARLSSASRQRLQKVFEHGQRCAQKNDFDYANQLFTQCVVEDPSNLFYLQSFTTNLYKKYNDNKKGAKLTGLKIKSYRSALTKAASSGKWEAAVQAGCSGLRLNPWDIPTLLAMAHTCEQLEASEGQLFFLRSALHANSQHVEVNRQAGMALQRMGQFDQAIACWHRVSQAQPQDEEARQAIASLSVEKTIVDGGYDSTLLPGKEAADNRFDDNEVDPRPRGDSVAQHSRHAPSHDQANVRANLSQEERLQESIVSDPTELDNYFRLADVCLHEQRFEDAEQSLGRGQQVAGVGNLQFLERLEDVQIRRANHQVTIAEQHQQQVASDGNQQLVSRCRKQANQVELEIYAARADRAPENLLLKYELGLRLKRAGKTKEAIPLLQASRGDPKRQTIVLLELGECFQKIEQYKLAISHYEQAIEACEGKDSETYRLGLYRAGVLSTGLRELDRAERHLTELAGLDYGYRDVADRLDKITQLRNSE